MENSPRGWRSPWLKRDYGEGNMPLVLISRTSTILRRALVHQVPALKRLLDAGSSCATFSPNWTVR